MQKRSTAELVDRIETGRQSRSEDFSAATLNAYQGFANRYRREVNDPELRDLLYELLKIAGGSDEYRVANSILQSGVIGDWCDGKKI